MLIKAPVGRWYAPYCAGAQLILWIANWTLDGYDLIWPVMGLIYAGQREAWRAVERIKCAKNRPGVFLIFHTHSRVLCIMSTVQFNFHALHTRCCWLAGRTAGPASNHAQNAHNTTPCGQTLFQTSEFQFCTHCMKKPRFRPIIRCSVAKKSFWLKTFAAARGCAVLGCKKVFWLHKKWPNYRFGCFPNKFHWRALFKMGIWRR